MTYEQASARGLRFRRDDGGVLTYRDGVVHHFTAAMTTAETAAKNRAKLLRDFLEFRRAAVQEGETGDGARVRAAARRTIRREPIGWRACWRHRASRCGAPRSR